MAKDITGMRFGKLVVRKLLRTSSPPSHNNIWECACDCGTVKAINQHRILYGGARSAKSCGCGSVGSRLQPRHGDTGSVEHRAWTAMFFRCYNTKHKDQRYYARLGIGVCARWRKYENFLADMGRRPPDKHSLDRIKALLGYRPSNCRWATWEEQAASRNVSFEDGIYGPNGTKKLRSDDVRRIRSNRHHLNQTKLADLFGVGPSTISNIATGDTWSWLK